VTNCVSDDKSFLNAANDKCVLNCGTDILNYAKNECIYALAGCSALDEYATGSPYKYCEKCSVGDIDIIGCIHCKVKNICL